MDIICAGEMLIDFTPMQQQGAYMANPGGAPANVAIATARNGLDTAFLGILGNDDFGKKLQGVLEEDHVKMLCPDLTDKAITTLAFVTLYEGGERSFTFARKPGADILLSKEDVKEADIADCRMLHAGSVSLSDDPSREAIGYALSLAKKHGKLVSFDVNYRDMIWHDRDRCKQEVEKLLPYIDFMKISDEELYFVGGEDNIEAFMKEHGITVLIETLGSKGARYFFQGNSDVAAGRKVNAVDATGAGDAFWGGFLSRMLMFGVTKPEEVTEDMVRTALAYGNAAGGMGLMEKNFKDILEAGTNVVTMGNYTWGKKDIFKFIDDPKILRPANYPKCVVGKGLGIYECKGKKIAVMNFLGRVDINILTENPFILAKEMVEDLQNKVDMIFIDFHAEATAEKIAMGRLLDGKITALFGTHTHVQTADEQILPQGTAYITDLGMTGPKDSVIGMDIKASLKRF